MLTALEQNPFVVMGSDLRDIDCERVWRAELEKICKRKKEQSTGEGFLFGCECRTTTTSSRRSCSRSCRTLLFILQLPSSMCGMSSPCCTRCYLFCSTCPARLVPQRGCGGVCGQHPGCSCT